MIRLNDGTELNGICSASGNDLNCKIGDKSFLECAILFSDSSKTERIETIGTQTHEVQDVFEGYTRLVRIVDMQNMTSVSLRKEQ